MPLTSLYHIASAVTVSPETGALGGGMKHLALISAVFLSACVPASVNTALNTSGARDATGRAVALISQHRQANGLPPVRADAGLTSAARHQATAMARAGVMSHDVGGSFPSRMAAYATGRGRSAENISVGTSTPEETIALWKASSSHNRNMLLPEITRVGMAQSGGYWALVLSQ